MRDRRFTVRPYDCRFTAVNLSADNEELPAIWFGMYQLILAVGFRPLELTENRQKFYTAFLYYMNFLGPKTVNDNQG